MRPLSWGIGVQKIRKAIDISGESQLGAWNHGSSCESLVKANGGV
jgi:hypothetical protein